MKWQRIALMLTILSLLVVPLAFAQSDDVVVPVYKESNHRIRFDNGTVRMYDVRLKKGESTAFHEHSADNFAVHISTTAVAAQTFGGQSTVHPVKAGEVSFASTAKGPYTHRIGCTNGVDFRVVDLEINSKSRLGPGVETPKRPDKNFAVLLETSRGRVYRMILKAGETTEAFTRPANTAIFAISGGRTREVTEGKPPRFWDSEPGNFRWVDVPDRLTIRNESVADLELVEIEIF
jgi:hypothetical protein